jgi:hypothetical protein
MPALFSFIVICAVFSLFLCVIVRRHYKWTYIDNIKFDFERIFKIIFGIIIFYGGSITVYIGSYYFDPSLCKVRCKGYTLLGGAPPYVGFTTYSLIMFCMLPAAIYVIVVVRTKRNEENV